MAYTRVTSTKSPWLAGTQAGDMFAVPISHGEGRFVADEATLRRLAENGQIATQYVDPDGNVATDMPFNPTAPYGRWKALLPRTAACWARWVTANARAKIYTRTYPLTRICRSLSPALNTSNKCNFSRRLLSQAA